MRERSRANRRRACPPQARPQRRVPPAWFETQRFGSGLESRCRYDAFGYRTAATAQRDVPVPKLPLQITSLFLALPRLQQMADVYPE
ncbi:hypothetical protein BN1095_4760001 [Clostridioides difficile]|uniref:Uncharacterized protein n=1 Tax=Clostridioides difficile TaxID=1496 RepID=A0A069ARQ7_CLODI|nr:hypothetical protein BN1095_4760001 [Clostridioides difficile]